MSVAAFCPNCGNRFALLANPEETLLLKALNAGPASEELLSRVLESSDTTLGHAVNQGAALGATPASSWRELAEEWVWVEPGRFVMGSPESESGREIDESPLHEVAICRGFHLAKYLISRGQWEEVMGTTPWSGRSRIPSSPTLPAVFISWNDVQEFAARLNKAAGQGVYRLPSEAEWEYACRAGTTTMWSFGDDRHSLGEYAWYIDSEAAIEDQSPQQVGGKRPNPWGLHDMHGNVWEWCQDVYSDQYYANSPSSDPTGPQGGPGSARAIRGGYFRYFTRHSRSAARNTRRPDSWHRALGARLVRA